MIKISLTSCQDVTSSVTSDFERAPVMDRVEWGGGGVLKEREWKGGWLGAEGSVEERWDAQSRMLLRSFRA